MYILGIDPGTGRTGWGIIKVEESTKISYIAHGCIVTTLDDNMHNRLKILQDELFKIINKYNPTCMVVEHIFFGMNSRTAISVSQARGVILLTCAISNLNLFEYTGISVKKLISGNGRAEKKEMQKIVRKLLKLEEDVLAFSSKDKAFDDAADALAIAIHHVYKEANKIPAYSSELIQKNLKVKNEKKSV